MDKKEIVRRLLKEGIMVTPEDLEKLNEDNLEEFIKNRGFKKEASTEKKIEEREKKETQPEKQPKPGEKRPEPERKQESRQEPGPKAAELKVSVAKMEAKPKLSTQDFVSFYRERFQRLRGILAKRVDAVSINKTKSVFSSLSVIGMVKEKTGRGYMLEDETGEIEVVTDQALDENDVVGVTGLVKEGKLFAGEVTYPDIHFNREIGKLDGVKVFLGRSLKGVNADVFFISGEIEESEKSKNVFSGLTNPAAVVVSRGREKVSMLYFRPGAGTQFHQAGEWLKKRHLPIGREGVQGPMDHSVLDPVPDVLWVDLDEKGSSLHKGVLVVCPGPGGALIDLGTKEVEFV